MTAQTTEKNDKMTLSECAAYDLRTNAKTRLTGWGLICKDRHDRGVSRKQRRLLKVKP